MTSAYPLVSHISIHALREEGDGFGTILRRGMVAFLSTPSARRATMILIWYMNADEDFYPRPPRGGRPGQQTANDTPIGISIHALREEGDGRCFAKAYSARLFLSTPSARRATTAPVWRGSKVVRFLSTPSARRATGNRSRHTAGHSDFYPRPPRGGRRGKYKDMIAARIFLSTPSARRATAANLGLC